MEFFKGYVETRGKKCIEKFKGRKDFKTYEQVEKLPEFAGILANDTILVDIDDAEQSDILFKIVKKNKVCCRVYETTRGKHFLFRNNGVETNKTGTRTAIGIIADIKLGTRNSYEVLKYQDKERKVLYDTSMDADPVLPKWLRPVSGKMEFLSMEAGDGRNQALFNYILTLQSNDYTVEECRDCIRIINDFVLKEPMSKNEVEVILRDDAFKKPIFFMKNTFLFDKFAVYLKNAEHIIKIGGQLHIYKDGVYIKGKNHIEAAMIKHLPQLNRTKRSEVLEYLNILIQENSETDADMIAFRNGLFDIRTGDFGKHTPEKIVTNKIEWDYNENAQDKQMDAMLNRITCKDAEVRQLLEEMIGYCLYRRNELRKAFVLTGDGSNGKSTFLAVIQSLLGESNIAALDLKELGDRFKTAELFGKLANIGDDIGDEFIANPAIFKKLTSGERVSVEMKGKDPFEFNNYSKLIFSANDIPRIKDKTGAVLDRLVIIPFRAKFNVGKKGFKQNIRQDLVGKQSAMEYLIQIGLDGLFRILDEQKFTQPEVVARALEEYHERNNPIIGFVKMLQDDGLKIENESTSGLYGRYQGYCLANNFQAISHIEFSRSICREYGFTIQSVWNPNEKKKQRIFIREVHDE